MHTPMKYRILDEDLIEKIAGGNPTEQAAWLILVPSMDFQGAWYVECLDPGFLFDFEDIIGNYRVLFPSQLQEFSNRAKEQTYCICFTEDPTEVLRAYEALREPPPFSIVSHLEGTVNGLLPWQVVGFNKLIRPDDLRGGLCLWDTGTGKTVFIASAILWHMREQGDARLSLVVVKSNNKRDMQRKLKKLAGIESVILDGPPDKRAKMYAELALSDEPQVWITNYEKFREDKPFFDAILQGERVLILWDEMPTKLKNRGSQLYNAVRDCLYASERGAVSWKKKRPAWLRQYELTATPVETDPGDQFSCVRLIDPDVLGTISKFEKEHVISRNPISKKPQRWHRLDRMSHKLQHMMHRVDKTDPEVAKYFPKMIEDRILVDWNPQHRKLYDSMVAQAKLMIAEDEEISILSLIMALQMACDAPSMLVKSAANREVFEALLEAAENDGVAIPGGIKTGSEMALRLTQGLRLKFTDDGHPKWERLREDLLEKHPESKALVFSTWSDYIFPVFEKKLQEWGITYEVFRGTNKQRQDAKDHWRTTSDCRVLVSSDAGSDSIDLPEANLVVNFNLPTLYSRRYQRVNRASRADSGHEVLYAYDYAMAGSVEERRIELIEQREEYHHGVIGTAAKVAQSMSYSQDDLLYMLLGNEGTNPSS